MRPDHPINQVSNNIKWLASNQRGMFLGILVLFSITNCTALVGFLIQRSMSGACITLSSNFVFLGGAFIMLYLLAKRSPQNFDGRPLNGKIGQEEISNIPSLQSITSDDEKKQNSSVKGAFFVYRINKQTLAFVYKKIPIQALNRQKPFYFCQWGV